jgi:hypothetical protein
MSMSHCDQCGQPYQPQSSAWGATCGVCIASRIGRLLMHAGGVSASPRRPLRRSSADTPDTADTLPATGLRRQA